MTLSEISYQGSKSRFMKVLKPLIENNLDEGMTYIEPFGGGMNSFTPINASKKIANDVNEYNIALWLLLKEQGFNGVETEWSEYLNILSNCEDKPNGPNYLRARELYSDMKKDCLNDGGKYPKALLGFVAYACSFGGGWWNGFIGYNEKKGENYVKEAIRGLKKHIDSAVNMENSDFLHGNYEAIEIPDNAFVYCDPPYANTKKYANDFDNERFWDWCRELIETKENIKLLISEYNAPEDFVCIWSKGVQDSMGNNTMSKNEKLFVHNSQVSQFDLSSLSETISISRNDIMEMVKKSIKRILSENIETELQAWHGSQADFNNFDMSFMGTGEGNQTYGWGIYLTDVKDTGRWYAATISVRNNKDVDKDNHFRTILELLKTASKKPGEKRDTLVREMTPENFETNKNIIINNLSTKLQKASGKVKTAIQDTINYITPLNSKDEINQLIIKLTHKAASKYERTVYTVDIPDEGYLDWTNTDKVFLKRLFDKFSQKFDTSHVDFNNIETFGDLYKQLRGWDFKCVASKIKIPQKELSLFLLSLGYVGIRVPTGFQSGGDGRGTNIIMFDAKDIKIIKKDNLKDKEDFDI